LFLLAFSAAGAASCIYFFNDKLEKMLNIQRLPPLRWLAAAFAVLAVVLVALALIALL
jgi:uncharacterized membrane protein YbhN (UPF0104 family)